MRKQMIENAAYEVATQVRAVEESIEAALARNRRAAGPHGARALASTGVGFVASHAAFEQLAAAPSGLIAARGGIANCHVALAESARTIPGLRTVAHRRRDECPPKTAAPTFASSPRRRRIDRARRSVSGRPHDDRLIIYLTCCCSVPAATPCCAAGPTSASSRASSSSGVSRRSLLRSPHSRMLFDVRARRLADRRRLLRWLHLRGAAGPTASGRCGSPACS